MSMLSRSALLGATLLVAVAAAPAAMATTVLDGDTSSAVFTQTLAKGITGGQSQSYVFKVAVGNELTDVSVVTSKNVGTYNYTLYNSNNVAVATTGTLTKGATDISSDISYTLAAGTYTLKVVASLLKTTTNATDAATVTVSAVPLPAALPLFGSALVGIGLLGRRRAKTKVA